MPNALQKARDLFYGIGNSLGVAGTQNGNVLIRNNSLAGRLLQGSQRVAQAIQKPEENLWYPQALAQGKLRTGIKPIDYAGQRMGNYIQNMYVASAKQLPQDISNIVSNKPVNIGGYQIPKALNPVARVGKLGLDVLGAIPDPTDVLYGGLNFLKGTGVAQREKKGFLGSLDTQIKAMTLEKPVGLGEALSTNPTTQTIGNIAELPLMLFFGGKMVRSNQADNLIKKAQPEIEALIRDVNSYDTFNPRSQMTIIDDVTAVAKKYIPQVVNSKEMKEMSTLNPRKWMQLVSTFLQDRVVIANHPEVNVGLGTRAMKKLDPTQPKGVGGAGGTLPNGQKSVSSSQLSAPKASLRTTKQQLFQPQPETIPSPSQSKSAKPSVVASQPYFNTNRLNVSDETRTVVRQTVSEIKPQIEEVVGKKLSNKEVVDFSNVSSRVLHKAVDRQQTLEWEAALLKARQILSSQAVSGTMTKEYLDNLLAIKSLGSDTARKLQSFSIGADPKLNNAKGAILEAILKVTDDAEKILKESKGVDFNNYEQTAAFYRKFVKPNAGDWIEKIRYTSMLSSPNTHINNTMSNFQGTALIAPIEKTITGMVDFLKSTVTGKKRSAFTGEGVAYMRGYWSKLHEASQNFADVMSGRKFSTAQELHNLPLTAPGTTGRKVENTQNFFPRLLQASDEFFTTLTEGAVMKSLEYRASRGVKTRFPEIKATAEARKRLFNAPFNLDEEGPVLKALEYLPMKVAEARNSNNPVVRTVAKYTFPFVRIPSNILKASVEYSPLGVLTLPGAKNKVEQVSKAILGTSIGLGTAMLVGSDRMTWSEPTDPKKKSMFRAAGMQPYSVKVGNKWISFSKLHPAIAFNMALVAAVRDAERNKSLSDSEVETVLNGAAKWVNFYADMSYVKNIGDFVSSAKGDAEGISRYLSNYPQQLIPFRALMGWVTRIIDPYQRKIDTTGNVLEKQLQQLSTQIPLLSQTVPARLDQSGQPIENQNRLFNAITPIGKVTTEKTQEKNMYLYLGGQTAKQTYNSLKKLSPEEANRISKIIKQQNPTLYSNLVKIKKQANLGVSRREEKYINLNILERATKVADELNKLSTREEKNVLVKRYTQLGIITDDVKKQLLQMKRDGRL